MRINAHDAACPVCHAPKGEACRYPDGTSAGNEISHSLRVLEAFKAGDAKSEDDALLGGWSA